MVAWQATEATSPVRMQAPESLLTVAWVGLWVGWLFGWWVGLVGWLVCWFVGWFVGLAGSVQVGWEGKRREGKGREGNWEREKQI